MAPLRPSRHDSWRAQRVVRSNVKQPSLSLSRERISAGAFRSSFHLRFRKSAERVLLPRREEAERRNGACLHSRSYGERTGFAKTGLALRRSTAVFEEPWDRSFLPVRNFAQTGEVFQGLPEA